ncbi:uncharacterized protein LOC103939346 [Pyrus x bretschneideri]|uniref:uncharacterized protein LOC103939346 n=1 Tax=Pyrus x bretschneideri TaxID=225117 RepID=UPI002030DE5C|nr:uncharacterized protein LOC103939346 [Pyrus x bretschneideri]XP_018501033.2 uncharacterized protein LOC103939346 [Pyrus x bretschneideri]
MGFNAVFGCLKEVFPQVDFRILKAIAIEHPFDADAAVLDVINEFPNLATQSFSSAFSPTQVQSPEALPVTAQHKDKGKLLMHQQVIKEPEFEPLPEPEKAAVDDDSKNDHTSGISHDNPTLLGQVNSFPNGPVPSEADISTGSEEVISDGKGMNFDVQVGLQQSASGITTLSMPGKDVMTAVDDDSKNDHTHGISHDNPTLLEQVNSFPNGPVPSDADIRTGSEKVISDGKVMNFDVQVGLQQSASGITTLSMPGKDATTAVDDDNKNDHTNGISHDNPTLLEQVNSFPNGPVPSDADISTGSEEVISDGKGMNFDVQVGLQQSASGITTLSMPGKDVMNGTLVDAFPEWKSFYLPLNCDSDLALHDTRDQVEPFAVDSSFVEHSLDASQCDVPCSDPLLADDNLRATDPSDHTSEKECSPREMVDIEENTTDSVCNTDVLEEIIENAKNNKKTLFSAMESVISMMREVEVQEKEVDIVQKEASRGGLDIMVKVEELKQMLAHAKDGNDMHAGEVYGEKAILATEARELQSRLLNLSDERDKSLAVLNEMRETLEERLDAAAEARRLAEQDKLEKEECARKALAEQEAEMEKVVQESKILQQEADENSKLREFLMDRGRIVDMLQGEISVICQDVRLLKEKFDERVPLSQSVSSSQTSCILASSGSSMKSVALDLVSERLELLKSPEKVSPAPSVDGLSPKSILEQERSKADRKELMDDGWDVFDKDFDV